MIEREDLGSWMDGPPKDPEYVAGSALGLPADGPGSVAGFGRRVLTLFLDWGLCLLVSLVFFDYDALATLLLFIALNVVMLTLIGATPGQLALGERVTPVRGRMPMLVRALIRTAVMLLVVPAVFWNRDRQPTHDLLAGTAVVRS